MLLFRRIYKPFHLSIKSYQVTVVGGASDVGQTICLLLRTEPSIKKLVLHDTIEQTPGVLLDLSHIPSKSSIQAYSGEETLDHAIKESDLIIAVGGMQRQPGLKKKALITANTKFMKSLSVRVAKLNPMPFVGIVTEPVNSMVPMVAEIMRNYGDSDSKKLCGITGVDAIRAQSIYAIDNNLNPHDCNVPVIGGHSAKTIIPLLTQTKPLTKINEKLMQEFTEKVRKCDDKITSDKKGFAPTLSIAYSVLIFTRGILNALGGTPVKLNAFVENNDFGTSYFAGLVSVGPNGFGEMQRYTNLSNYECYLLERTITQLRKDVFKGKRILELAE
ncbi:hypothetical protein K1T71_005149 [Dendrolimus kikuchii]|uniref:Uncharacterized protein n=1 Tax=Dendrolimus kikuchii TaxID=765133 RepID=A0ACC1D7P6_9NEOP|nr:hypothetical protein K1T71_005149 [Dendrolimus kikuchii]